jgi:hypothetical protein
VATFPPVALAEFVGLPLSADTSVGEVLVELDGDPVVAEPESEVDVDP